MPEESIFWYSVHEMARCSQLLSILFYKTMAGLAWYIFYCHLTSDPYSLPFKESYI